MDWCKKWLVDFNFGKTQLVSFDWSKNNGSIDMKMDGSVFEEKSFLRCWGWPSLLNWVGVLVLSLLLKLPPRKLESNSFYEVFFPEVALYLYKFTVHPCMEYCCHVWAGATSCFLEFLDKLQKWICRTVGPSLATSLESLAHRRSVTSLSLFYRCYFGRCSSELPQLVPLPCSGSRSTCYSDRLHDFSVTIPRCYKDVYVNSFF